MPETVQAKIAQAKCVSFNRVHLWDKHQRICVTDHIDGIRTEECNLPPDRVRGGGSETVAAIKRK